MRYQLLATSPTDATFDQEKLRQVQQRTRKVLASPLTLLQLVVLALQLALAAFWLKDRQSQSVSVHNFADLDVWPSTHDYRPKRGLQSRDGGPVRVMVIMWYHTFVDRMDTWHYEAIDAMRAHPGVFVDVFGPGWQGWDSNKTMMQNVEARTIPPEIARPEHPSGPVGCGFYDLIISEEDKFRHERPTCGTLRIQAMGDCHHDGQCIDKLEPENFAISTSRYGAELVERLSYRQLSERLPQKNWPMPLFAYIPDAANEWDFYPKAWSKRSHEAVLFGAAFEFYPIRHTVERAHRLSPDKTMIEVFDHPGYDLISADQNEIRRPATYLPDHPAGRLPRQARIDFASMMRSSKICVFDSSTARKLIRKYHQAFLSGCVVAADIPTEQEEALKDFVIQLNQTWTIEQIDDAVGTALLDDAELQRKAMAAYLYARQRLTYTRQADRILETVERYRAGERGYVMYEPVSQLCRASFNVMHGPNNTWIMPTRPEWCRGDEYLVYPDW